MPVSPSLQAARSPLADPATQLQCLRQLPGESFAATLTAAGRPPLVAAAVTTLQVNLGKRCNQACRHCHVDAAPDRREVMPDAVVEACLAFLARSGVRTLDITGGAPEMHPRFADLVRRARDLGCHVMDRCNLTILTLPAYADLAPFLAANAVEIVASLPSVAPRGTDTQRGDGVHAQSLAALRRLNDLGYGQPDSGLILNLVTNPVGAFLPGNQASLEREWRRDLANRYGIVFNRLYTITNMPISRFLQFLQESGNLDAYLEKLRTSFNPAAVDGLMCRQTLSVGWDGRLFDCDFNQMLDLPSALPGHPTIVDLVADVLPGRPIVTAPHCFGCTAGAGSSCGGATV